MPSISGDRASGGRLDFDCPGRGATSERADPVGVPSVLGGGGSGTSESERIRSRVTMVEGRRTSKGCPWQPRGVARTQKFHRKTEGPKEFSGSNALKTHPPIDRPSSRASSIIDGFCRSDGFERDAARLLGRTLLARRAIVGAELLARSREGQFLRGAVRQPYCGRQIDRRRDVLQRERCRDEVLRL